MVRWHFQENLGGLPLPLGPPSRSACCSHLIHSDRFIWLHFPKTAGTAVERLFRRHFRRVRSVRCDVVSHLLVRLGFAQPIWHDSLAERKSRQPEFSWSGKAVICGMRRLPDWLYSRHTFEMQRSPALEHNPENLLTGRFFEQTGALGFADHYMRKYLPPDLLESGAVRVIRVEHFRQDFTAAFRDFLPVERIPEQDFAIMRNRTRTMDDNARRLIQTNLEQIYRSCPYWADVESRFYSTERTVLP